MAQPFFEVAVCWITSDKGVRPTNFQHLFFNHHNIYWQAISENFKSVGIIFQKLESFYSYCFAWQIEIAMVDHARDDVKIAYFGDLA